MIDEAPIAPLRASEALNRILDETTTVRIRVGDIVAQLGDRSFPVVLVILALPNCIPGPPAVTSLFGLPQFLVALQLMIGRKRPWLPRIVTNREFAVADLKRLMIRSRPWLNRVERFCRPRGVQLFGGALNRWLGLLHSVLALCVSIPLPLTNLPPAIATVLISFATLERDALLLTIGLGVAVLSIVLATVMVTAVVSLIALPF